ncbi:unnamed protein product [Mesocestoides corti]|uniref:Ig-like domain-containing protein n=1 Tax=Mesocestoides corti TaxID=53468 RepID=A0A0R3U4I5_MESCO|nr:unnamed protein product [Mesocestoides corti]
MDWNYVFLNSIFYLINSLTFVRTREISAEEVCRICDGCIYESISCQEAGRLYMLPNDLPSGIRKVIIVGQRFESRFLSRRNISSYSLPGMAIQELTIMDCGLRAIESQTFYGLSSLTKLDLSKNSLSRIQAHTFSSLRLDLLRLDDNQGLLLEADAFENLTVTSLSMQNCGLQSLSFEVFKPLLLSGTLTTLRLTSNLLTTINAQFEPFFRNLSFLTLSRNPFTCDCKLMWLSRTLQRKRRSDSEDAFSHLPLAMANDDRLLTVPDGDHPVCEHPNRLRGKQIVSLTPADFFCGPPQVQALEVDFGDIQGQGLNGTAVVQIKCAARGSPEMQLGWYRRSRRSTELIQLPSSREVSPGVVEASLTRFLHANSSGGSVDEEGELLTCLGVDTNGNTSADLSIRWPPPLAPPDSTNKNLVETETDEAGGHGVSQTHYQSVKPDRIDDFFFVKKFTILELIGAVVGTFTATILLFLIGYVLLYVRHGRQCPKSPKGIYPLVSNSGLTKFPDYQVLDSSPQPTAQSPLEAISNRSCDPTDSKRRLAQMGEWTETGRSRRPEGRNSSGVYSECPIYDLPSSHLTSSPLPPLPPDPPPPSPPSVNHFATVGGIPIVYPQQHFIDAVNNNNLLAQSLTTNAILVDMLTLQRRQHQLQQQANGPHTEFRL